MVTDKYEEIFKQTLAESKGDALERYRKATSEVRLAILRDVPVWMKFNMISWMIGGKKDDEIDWEVVNKLLKADNEYDFDAFDYIDSMEKFGSAAADSRVADIPGLNTPFVKRVCKDCGDKYTLNRGQVMFYCKHEYPLPKRCDNCLSIKKTGKPLEGYKLKEVDGKKVAVKIEPKTYEPGFTEPLNGFAEALKKIGLKATNPEA